MEQQPTIERVGGPHIDSIARHPAYAQIDGARMSGKTYLYGSDFAHQNFIAISIHASELNRSLSRDWPFATREYIEVWLSEAQWAAFVSSLNVGTGVQCTLRYRDGERIPDLPRPAPRTDQFKQEMAETMADALALLRKLRERIAAGKGGKEALATLDKAVQEIEKNTVFVAGQFSEHVEDTVEAAKTEVNAYIQGTITRLGLEALAPPLAIEGSQEEDR